MKRVKIWIPELEHKQEGKSIVTTIKKKKGKFVKEASILDSTLAMHKAGGDQRIIHEKQYFEEVPMPDPQEDAIKKLVDDNSRDELNAKATELGIEEPEKLADKAAVAKAIVDKEKEGGQ